MDKQKLVLHLQTLFRVILGALLLLAGVFKLQDNSALFETVAYITWLPTSLKSILVDVLPYVEIIVGALLALNMLNRLVIPAAAIIYLGFFLFAIYGLGTGMEGDCGCFGDPEKAGFLTSILGSTFGWPMIIRNGIFVAMAGFLFWKPEPNSAAEDDSSQNPQ